jgi:acylphosphatase
MSITKRLVILGRVQGVGFRYSMCAQAESLGVTGTVKNRSDGNVEAIVQGSAEQVHAIVEWAKKGPSGARVDRVDVSEEVGRFNDFSIAY